MKVEVDMRRWSMVVASAALVVGTVVGAGPAQAANANSFCRQITNEVRQQLPDSLGHMNQEFNEIRNAACKSVHK